jgi:hypothetical protein
VLWQFSQLLLLWTWVEVLPVAVVPLWQVKQDPVTLLWSKRAGFHAEVVWQLSQLLSLWIWVGVLPVAVVPL